MEQEKTPGHRHAEFAQEVVALAWKHGMDNLTITFRADFMSRDTGYSGLVTATWHQGRHGDKSRINLRFDGATGIEEKDATND